MNLQEQLYSFVPQFIKNLKKPADRSSNQNIHAVNDTTSTTEFPSMTNDQKNGVVEFLRSINNKSITIVIDMFIRKMTTSEFVSVKWEEKLKSAFYDLWLEWSAEQMKFLDLDFDTCQSLLYGLEIRYDKKDTDEKQKTDFQTVYSYLRHYIQSGNFCKPPGT